MSILDRFKRRPARTIPESRTLPRPTRVSVADHEEAQEHFVRILEWSAFTPSPPIWELPSLAEQRARIEALIVAHAEAGTLDGLVPDLLDRLIHDEMEESRHEIEEAHTQATVMAQRLWEQAKAAQKHADTEVEDVRRRWAEAEAGYEAAYATLTGSAPRRDTAARAVEPALIPTQIAPVEALIGSILDAAPRPYTALKPVPVTTVDRPTTPPSRPLNAPTQGAHRDQSQ